MQLQTSNFSGFISIILSISDFILFSQLHNRIPGHD